MGLHFYLNRWKIKIQKIGKLSDKNMDFITVPRASRCHPYWIKKEQQLKGKAQLVYLSILHNCERKSFSQHGTKFILLRREGWERKRERARDVEVATFVGLASWKQSFCFLYANSIINIGMCEKGCLLHRAVLVVVSLLVFYRLNSHQKSNLMTKGAVSIFRDNLKVVCEALGLVFRTD